MLALLSKRARLQEEVRRLAAENDSLREQLHHARRTALQWGNLFRYDGTPQSDNLETDWSSEAANVKKNGSGEEGGM